MPSPAVQIMRVPCMLKEYIIDVEGFNLPTQSLYRLSVIVMPEGETYFSTQTAYAMMGNVVMSFMATTKDMCQLSALLHEGYEIDDRGTVLLDRPVNGGVSFLPSIDECKRMPPLVANNTGGAQA